MGGCKNVTILATLVLWKSHSLENEVHPLIFQSNIRSQQLHLLDVLGFSGPEMEEWFIPLFCLRPGGREFDLQIPLGQEYLVHQHLTPSLVGYGDLSRGGQKVLWVRTRTSLGGTIILPTLEGEIFRSFSPIKTGNAFTNYLQISDFSRLLYYKIKHKEKYAKQIYS